eukprot:765552-Hanusia_phi.AAC.1
MEHRRSCFGFGFRDFILPPDLSNTPGYPVEINGFCCGVGGNPYRKNCRNKYPDHGIDEDPTHAFMDCSD